MRIQRFFGIARVEFAIRFDLGNLAVFNPNIPEVTRGAGTIDDSTALDKDIIFSHIFPPFWVTKQTKKIERSLRIYVEQCHRPTSDVNTAVFIFLIISYKQNFIQTKHA
jgi:hypothetical protein